MPGLYVSVSVFPMTVPLGMGRIRKDARDWALSTGRRTRMEEGMARIDSTRYLESLATWTSSGETWIGSSLVVIGANRTSTLKFSMRMRRIMSGGRVKSLGVISTCVSRRVTSDGNLD